MAGQKKILFITPGAQSFGGNIFLLNFLRWFKRNCDIPFMTLYGFGGDLEKEFAELSPVYQFNFDDSSDSFVKKAFGKAGNHLELKRTFLKARIKRENIGLIYSNAVTNDRMLSMFDDPGVPVITHCHELESLIQLSGIECFDRTKKRTSHFVAVSDAVRQNLIRNHQISHREISLIHGFVPVENIPADAIKEKREMVRAELGIPADAFVVGASGTLNWRKAPEFFIQIAHTVRKKAPAEPIYFVWVGGARKGNFKFFEIGYDLEKARLKERVFFLEHKTNPLDHFAAFDCFAMVSREDPFPLVCLESASLGKPVLCFEGVGGMPEFVGLECGFTIPYMDFDDFAEKIIFLAGDKALTAKLGENARVRVEKHHNIETAAQPMLDLIKKYLQ